MQNWERILLFHRCERLFLTFFDQWTMMMMESTARVRRDELIININGYWIMMTVRRPY